MYSPIEDADPNDEFVPSIRQLFFINGVAVPTDSYVQNVETMDCSGIEPGDLFEQTITIGWDNFDARCPDLVEGRIAIGQRNLATNNYGPSGAFPCNFGVATAEVDRKYYPNFNEGEGAFLYCAENIDDFN